MTSIWHNGALIEDAPILSITDRALRGHGVFDTMLVVDGRVVHAERHFKRLIEHASILKIPVGEDAGMFISAASALIERNEAGAGRHIINSHISIGPAARGLKTPEEPNVQIVMRISPAPESLPDVKAIIAKSTRRNEGSVLSRIKSMNYGDNILAYQEAEAAGANEAIMLNNTGNVTCATTGNIFAVIDGKLVTPPLLDGVMAGITRDILIEHYDVIERSLTVDDLKTCEGLYLTNSLRGAQPVVELDGSRLPAPSLPIPQDFHLE